MTHISDGSLISDTLLSSQMFKSGKAMGNLGDEMLDTWGFSGFGKQQKLNSWKTLKMMWTFQTPILEIKVKNGWKWCPSLKSCFKATFPKAFAVLCVATVSACKRSLCRMEGFQKSTAKCSWVAATKRGEWHLVTWDESIHVLWREPYQSSLSTVNQCFFWQGTVYVAFGCLQVFRYFFNISGQIIIFQQPRFPWNEGISLIKPRLFPNTFSAWIRGLLNHHLGWGRVKSL